MSLKVSKTSVSKRAIKGIEPEIAEKSNRNQSGNIYLFICSPVPKYKLLVCHMAEAEKAAKT